MSNCRLLMCLLMVSLLSPATCQSVRADDAKLKSGPKVGSLPLAFYVRDVTGRHARGPKVCYRCEYGTRPVVSVFARNIDPNLIRLLKELDKSVARSAKDQTKSMKKLASFCVLLTDDPDAAEAKLKRLQKEHNIRNIPLTVFDGSAGPRSYRIHRDADVTVSMWVRSDIKQNRAFRRKELTAAAVKQVGESVRKLAPVSAKPVP